MISGTEARGLQAHDPQDQYPPHLPCEARGNNRTTHVRVSARPHIEIPHTVVRMLMHQYSASPQSHAGHSSAANGPLPSLTDDLFSHL